MSAFTVTFAAEQAVKRLLALLRLVPGLLAGLLTAWLMWPAPVPPPPLFYGDEYPADAGERTIVGGLPFPVRPYVDLARWKEGAR